MEKIKIILLIIPGMLLMLSGCYPGGPEYTSDYDLVATDYSPDYWNANSPATYFMPDSLGWIIDRENIDNIDSLTRDYDEFILGEVERNLAALGYERIETLNRNNPPDVFVFTQALAVKNTSVSYIPWYPWYGGYWPGWGGYWPGYGWGGTPVVYSYSTGTVLIEMGDALNIDEEQKLVNIVWTAAIDGLLRSSTASNQQFVSQSIDQAFNQSLYLK